MGILHNELRRGPLGRALKNALGDTSSTGQLERFGETLQPVIDLWQRPDWSFLRDEQLWAFAQTVAAVVGELSGAAVVNPTGSNRIVTVTSIAATNGTVGGALGFALTTEAVITPTYALFAGGGLAMPNRDSRIAGVALRMPLPQFWTGSNPGALITANLRTELMLSAVIQALPAITAVPAVLSPGFALIVEGQAANQAVHVSMAGSIRVAMKGEL